MIELVQLPNPKSSHMHAEVVFLEILLMKYAGRHRPEWRETMQLAACSLLTDLFLILLFIPLSRNDFFMARTQLNYVFHSRQWVKVQVTSQPRSANTLQELMRKKINCDSYLEIVRSMVHLFCILFSRLIVRMWPSTIVIAPHYISSHCFSLEVYYRYGCVLILYWMTISFTFQFRIT